MNIIFFGTPEFATRFLKPLLNDQEIVVSAVVTQPDKPVGRKGILTPSPVKLLAEKHGIPVFTPEKMKDETFISALKHLEPDLFVIVAYGRILPESLLSIPKSGNVNVHPSLLPKYRGPSPVQAAIAAGEAISGVSIMLIDKEMDHGPLLAQETIQIAPDETPATFYEKSSAIGAPILLDAIKRYLSGDLQPISQDHTQATFSKLLTREDGKINWTTPAVRIESTIRGYKPWPGTFTTWNGKQIKIHAARVTNLPPVPPGSIQNTGDQLLIGTATHPLEILELQPEGKTIMTTKEFLRGNTNLPQRVDL